MLKAVIEELARRFATSAGGTGRQRLRERTDDLVLDLLAAMKASSLSEIAETERALERRRKTRNSARATTRAAYDTASSPSGSRRREASAESEKHTATEEAQPVARDPFDITVPSDLLDAPTTSPPVRDPARVSRRSQGDLASLSVTSGASVVEPPHRSVSLREGEQLLRTGGAGAVIRRVRGS